MGPGLRQIAWTQAHDKHFADGGVFDKIYGTQGQ